MPKIALYSARKTNAGWGYGNRVLAAIQRLGWEVVFDCDYRKENFRKGQELPEDTVHLILKGERFQAQDIQALKGKKVLWYPDQLVRFPDRQEWVKTRGPHFHLLCVSHLDELRFYKDLSSTLFLPVGYSPEFHKDYSEGRERPYDVGFAGSMNPARKRYLDAFEAAGIPVTVKSVFGEDLQRFYSQCKIVWNLGWGGGGIQTRFIEAMGAGAVIVTNSTVAETGSPFKDGEHLVEYHDGPGSERAAADLMKKMLEDPVKLAAIAAKAKLKLQSESIDTRLRTMVEHL